VVEVVREHAQTLVALAAVNLRQPPSGGRYRIERRDLGVTATWKRTSTHTVASPD
jgi:hypothetical protein